MKYKKPKYSAQECIDQEKTFSISIYAPLEIKYKNQKLFQAKYILVGEIALLSEKGTFIFNGNTRIIVNQIVRSPGIYFQKDKNEKAITSTIIPNQGSWLTIKLNKKGLIYTKIDKIQNSIPFLVILQAMGITRLKIIKTLENEVKAINFKRNLPATSTKEALLNLNKILLEQNVNLEDSRQLLYEKFINTNKYNLGEIGRININKKLYKKEFWTIQKVIQPEDLLGAINYILKINSGLNETDDIDDLKNKRIRSTGELLQNQIKTAIYELENNIKNKIMDIRKQQKLGKQTANIGEIINPYIITNSLKNFFASNPLSQLLDEINSLAEITHKRKVSSFGVGALDKKQANLKIREIHPSQYSRICPIETSEGKNAGLILSLSKDVEINKYGFIESPFYRVIKNKIQINTGIFYVTANQETNYKFSADELIINCKKKIKKKRDVYKTSK